MRTESQTPRLLLGSQSLLLLSLSGSQNLEMDPVLLSFRLPELPTFTRLSYLVFKQMDRLQEMEK
jgi:hypothetical protein